LDDKIFFFSIFRGCFSQLHDRCRDRRNDRGRIKVARFVARAVSFRRLVRELVRRGAFDNAGSFSYHNGKNHLLSAQ